LRSDNRDETLEAVAEDRQQRSFPVSGAQHIGRARVAGAVIVRIGKPERATDDDGERDRPD
jgi:hypothetical protein